MVEEHYYTPPQAARILGISRRRVTQMLNDGQLEGEQSDNGRWKIPAATVVALLRERSAQPTHGRSPSVAETVWELKDRMLIMERRIERLTDSLSRSFGRLEHIEQKLEAVEQELKDSISKLEEKLDHPSQ
jgi:excisionase family DNA binding protein